MEFKQIKELMASMGRNGIKRIAIKKEDFEIELEQHEQPCSAIECFPPEQSQENHNSGLSRKIGAPSPLPKATDHPTPHRHEADHVEVAGNFITSPMVGTYYSSPSPEDPPFVKVGDKVDKNTIVCIIEAMKVMNEIKAGATGTIAEILIESGHPVEFGAKLFKIV